MLPVSPAITRIVPFSKDSESSGVLASEGIFLPRRPNAPGDEDGNEHPIIERQRSSLRNIGARKRPERRLCFIAET
jgi:hypothetical protein